MRALTITLCLLATLALADVAGVASVIDGDTIEVHGQHTSWCVNRDSLDHAIRPVGKLKRRA